MTVPNSFTLPCKALKEGPKIIIRAMILSKAVKCKYIFSVVKFLFMIMM